MTSLGANGIVAMMVHCTTIEAAVASEEPVRQHYLRHINPFTPEFITWTLPSPNLDTSIVANRGFNLKKFINRMANSVDPDETAHYEPTAHYEQSCLNLHCLQRYLYWSADMKGLKYV